MDNIYVLLGYNFDWEDMTIYLTHKDAVEASIHHPRLRVEIFQKNSDGPGYTPTYNYYQNGNFT